MKTYKDYGIEIPYGRTGGNVKTFCPRCRDTRHNKTDKSLSVNLDKGCWNCHHCGWTGGLNEHSERKPMRTYAKPVEHLVTEFSPKMVSYLRSRGLSINTLLLAKVSEGLEPMPPDWKPRNTIQFNYYQNGELVNTKFRTGDKKFKMVRDARVIFYNIDSIKGKEECIITEGEFDALSFIEVGKYNVVSVPSGGGGTQLEFLDEAMEDYFDDKKVIYIASDTDATGVKLKNELIRRFGAERCRIVTYGDDCKDANEHLVKYGRDSLLKCLDNAEYPKVDGIITADDVKDEFFALLHTGFQRGVTIGLKNFDYLCSFTTQSLCVVTGVPGSGKSEFIDEIAVRLAVFHGWRFAFFSPENAPVTLHMSKWTEKLTGKKFKEGLLSINEARDAFNFINSNFFSIVPKENTLENILERARFLVVTKGIKALVIDPFNMIEYQRTSKNDTDNIRSVLLKLRNFARENDIMVILMAHPAKQYQPKEGDTHSLGLYDIAGSAHFYNMADLGIVVSRDTTAKRTIVKIAKVRFRQLGSTGKCKFVYNLENGRYSPAEDDMPVYLERDNLMVRKEKGELNTANIQAAEKFFKDAGLPELTDDDPLGAKQPINALPF